MGMRCLTQHHLTFREPPCSAINDASQLSLLDMLGVHCGYRDHPFHVILNRTWLLALSITPRLDSACRLLLLDKCAGLPPKSSLTYPDCLPGASEPNALAGASVRCNISSRSRPCTAHAFIFWHGQNATLSVLYEVQLHRDPSIARTGKQLLWQLSWIPRLHQTSTNAEAQRGTP